MGFGVSMIKSVISDDLGFGLRKTFLDKTRRRQRAFGVARPYPSCRCDLLREPALHRESVAFTTMIQRSFKIRLTTVSPGGFGVADNPDVHVAIVY